ncbi:MAG: acyl-CoA dehydrogenase family protein [Flavobacteriaceae bacterium]|nr:acyl-CoA dehydrogenase family protein [Flavobacteriaceae bacterium]
MLRTAVAIVDGVLALEGEDLVLYETVAGERPPRVVEVGSGAHAFWNLGAAEGRARRVLARGDAAAAAFALGLAEWKLLTAFALVGLARAALEQGARYAKERVQFGVPIGSFQAVAHPLADCATRVDGAELLCWEAAWARDAEPDRFASLASMAFVWAGQTAQRTASVSLHTHGGYGFSLEYDIQMAYRRAFAWPLAAGGTQQRALGRSGVDARLHA